MVPSHKPIVSGKPLRFIGACSSVGKEFRGRIRLHDYEIWAPNGRYLAVPERPWDIVGPWLEDRPESEMVQG